ncbi:MAG: RHS repeat-associated core domain-containing protein, partial [Candidatus Electrothrix sp. AW2]|nr:RHS repeat-associated core domain-containing protein [Candidatus Electrothrix gigas]
KLYQNEQLRLAYDLGTMQGGAGLIGTQNKTLADNFWMITELGDERQHNTVNELISRNGQDLVYDDDGNLLDDGAKIYEWDVFNRLRSVTTANARIAYSYDAQGRRVSRDVDLGNDGSVERETAYFYSGWNCIEERITENGVQATKTYAWGSDLSGTMQGAGGVGGLLAVTDGTGTYTAASDANGNVTAYFDGSGDIAAEYDYAPFGTVLSSNGDMADAFAYRFSTKPYDTETELYYYGYRYYLPELGRWISRDPIGEDGGFNLYVFVLNDAVNLFDVLGTYYNDPSLTDPIGYYDYDDLMVAGIAQKQINGFRDALSHYRSGAGGVVPAGPGLYAEMRSHKSYRNRVAGNDSWIAEQIKKKLRTVPKNQTRGTLSNANGSFVGNLQSKTLGSYGLNIQYALIWNAGGWQPRWHSFLTGSCFREVSTNATVNLTNTTDWNFQWNPQYSWFDNITREVIPGWIAGARGNPAGFDISLSLSENYRLQVEQDY